MRRYRNGAARTQCEVCPTRNRYVQPIQVGKYVKNLCGPCRAALEKMLLQEAEDAAPMATPVDAEEEAFEATEKGLFEAKIPPKGDACIPATQ